MLFRSAQLEQGPFRLQVARDDSFAQPVVEVANLRDPVFLPTEALPPGAYVWRWQGRGVEGETFSFTVPTDAVELPVPPVGEWLDRIGTAHPRLYLSGERQTRIRASLAGEYAVSWAQVKPVADQLLLEEREIAEPPYLPDRQLDYNAYIKAFGKAMWDSRAFVANSQTLAPDDG